jgi:flavodoxin/NAD-dependent dihydropyrimidine dehydrogenase PreA subunit
MKKTAIIYFSQNGSTGAIAEKIAKGLKDKEFQVDLFDITNGEYPDIGGYDMIGIGFPVYIYRPPFNVLTYLKSLKDLNGLPFFVFMMYGTKPGKSGNTIRTALTVKGGREIGYAKFKGADYFLGFLQRGVLFSPNNPDKEEITLAEHFGHDIVENFAGKQYDPPPADPAPGIVYSMEKLSTNKFFVRYVYTYFFKVDKEACNSCGICIQKCPNNNIRFNQEDIPIWGRNCIFCLYCEMKCPKDAIRSIADWSIMAPFMNYNIAQGIKDPSIHHVKITHSKGKTTKL